MERDDKPLPIDMKTLGGYAAKCHAYAKALHYKEMEFMSEPSPDTIEALISVNNQLQLSDAAVGILKYAQQNHNLELKESWYEKLQRWDDALLAYEKRSLEDPNNLNYTLGKMRCLQALGEWEQLSQLAQQKWFDTGADMQKMIAPLAAAAAWGLGQWELMDDYVTGMHTDSQDNAFFRAILAIHRNQFDEASDFIDKTRQLLDTNLKALVSESYERAYKYVSVNV
jgi:FKBP12-rapamycin complex-associated protein